MELTERRPVRTQFLVFTLFGDYVLPRGGTVWTSDLLYLLDLLGVSERAARSTLSRMTRKGWLAARKQGRCSQYTLTPRGWALLKQGEQRIFEPPFSNWDGCWHIVVYSLPEEKRRLRHSLRQSLTWLGHAPLAPGTRISPHNRRLEVENICRELGIQEYVEMFSGMHLGHASAKELASRCWDLTMLEDQYREFIAHHRTAYLQCLEDNDRTFALKPEECFARRFWLTYEFQSFPLRDPNLPTALLPPGWAGYAARELFEDYRGWLGTRANDFVDAIIKGDDFPLAGGDDPAALGGEA